MPFMTSRNPNQAADPWGQAANSFAKIFVGDPKADEEWRNQQIKNQTELARQKLYEAQYGTEVDHRRGLIDAQTATQGGYKAQAYAGARANNALAAGRERENGAHVDLGNLFTNGVDLSDPAQAGQVTGVMLRGGIDPKFASAMALVPGQSDETLGRIMTAGTGPLGKDEYVSVGDRNNNRTFEGNERIVRGNGVEIAPAVAAPGGGKVPKLGQTDANAIIRNALLARNARIDAEAPLASYFARQPQMFTDLQQLVAQGWAMNGGNAPAVQELLGQYLGNTDLSNMGADPFRPAADARAIIASRSGQGQAVPTTPEMRAPGAAPAAPIDPAIFTGGSSAPLPNLQNVGNGWRFIGVE